VFTLLANPLVIGIGGAVLALVIVALIVIKRYRIAEPDEAIIVTGRKGKIKIDSDGKQISDLSGQKVVTGGGIFVLPFVQKAFVLSLRSRRLTITTKAQTKNGITITARAVAVIKVGGSEEMIRSAAQRFLSQQEEIETSTQEVLSGSLRGIIGQLEVTDLIRDRAALASAVLAAAEEALTKQGLVVDTLQVQEINDESGYIDNLGRPESANVRRMAEVADTEATRASEEARISAEKLIVNANRDLSLQKAAVQAETDKALAEANAAKPLEDAIQRQRIVAQEEITATKEASLREQLLNADIRKVADAEAYRITTTAQANADAQVATARAERDNRLAQAEATKAEGEAEAFAISAKGKAEAEAIGARAAALEKEAGAVLAQQMIETLPLIAEKFAAAYSGIDNLTIVSADGANKLTGDVVSNMASMTTLMKDATGIDIQAIINGSVTGNAIGSSMGKAQGSREKKQARLAAPAPLTHEAPTIRKEKVVAEPVILGQSKIEEAEIENNMAETVSALSELSGKISSSSRETSRELVNAAHVRLAGMEALLGRLDSMGLNYANNTHVSKATKQISGYMDKLRNAGIDPAPLLSDYPLVSALLGYSV
jgi:flotillin